MDDDVDNHDNHWAFYCRSSNGGSFAWQFPTFKCRARNILVRQRGRHVQLHRGNHLQPWAFWWLCVHRARSRASLQRYSADLSIFRTKIGRQSHEIRWTGQVWQKGPPSVGMNCLFFQGNVKWDVEMRHGPIWCAIRGGGKVRQVGGAGLLTRFWGNWGGNVFATRWIGKIVSNSIRSRELTYPPKISQNGILSRWFSELPQVGYVNFLEGRYTDRLQEISTRQLGDQTRRRRKKVDPAPWHVKHCFCTPESWWSKHRELKTKTCDRSLVVFDEIFLICMSRTLLWKLDGWKLSPNWNSWQVGWVDFLITHTHFHVSFQDGIQEILRPYGAEHLHKKDTHEFV